MPLLETARSVTSALAEDLLEGADEIGDFLLGRDPDRAAKRARLR